MLRIAVIGYGYWGPNIVRNFSKIPDVCISWVCDLNPKTLIEVPKIYPTIKTTNSPADVLNDPEVNAIVIVTPPSTHFSLAKMALEAGKHVLVEKPITTTVRDAEILITIANKKKLTLMVDHTYLYTPAVKLMKQIIDSKELGSIYSIDCVRNNLGLLQRDANVIADLAVHDFSILDYILGITPEDVSATGITQKELKQETIAHIVATYKNELFVHMHVSWLSPIKIRRMILVGTKKMLIYDDIEPSEKIKIYDKGVSFIKDPKRAYQLQVGYRNGNVTIPHLDMEEGLFNMANEFVTAIANHKKPLTDGAMGLRVVQCLDNATLSLRNGGKTVHI
jgi:predicted dehydrogenase